ncbi:MAG TPA: nuclear transport factor 2 family protein [Rhizomicrobium sp.]|jgi:hypothetical protein|nr:nuclear transport factor 2 family protein [Rhizomicrobium sp.]
MHSLTDIARAYLKAIEDNHAVRDFLAADIEQVEHPNRLNPNGGRSDLVGKERRAERGRGMVRAQRYEVVRAYEQDRTVILEVDWSATFAVPIGSLPPGETMRAHFAVFLEFGADGRIHRQRNYDCFEPF